VNKPRSAIRLTEYRPLFRVYRHLDVCHICGQRSWGDMQLWRECDDDDYPIAGLGALVVTCSEKACLSALDAHPRLYIEEQPGQPGHFAPICVDCPWQLGIMCTHPHLRANGGLGLAVTIDNGRGVFMCGVDGAVPYPTRATKCEGRNGGPAAIGGGRSE
jgi:hypothetical protein